MVGPRPPADKRPHRRLEGAVVVQPRQRPFRNSGKKHLAPGHRNLDKTPWKISSPRDGFRA